MPKVVGTRKQKALELLRLCIKGPSIFPRIGCNDANTITKEEFEHHYKIWSESWIIYDLIDLIPELRKNKEKIKEKLLTKSPDVISSESDEV